MTFHNFLVEFQYRLFNFFLTNKIDEFIELIELSIEKKISFFYISFRRVLAYFIIAIFDIIKNFSYFQQMFIELVDNLVYFFDNSLFRC